MTSWAERCRWGWLRLAGEEGLTLFLVFLFLALFLEPFFDRLPTRPVTSTVLCLVMLSGVGNISQRPATRMVAGLAAFAAIALRWMTHLTPSPEILRWSSVASLLFMVMLTAVLLLRVFTGERPVTRNLVRGAVAVYLLFGISWSILYTLLDQTVSGAFTGGGGAGAGPERFIYFSFITLTTVGYGDITPAHEISRMCAVTEALVGQLYPATLLARLVSLEVSHREREAGTGGTPEERHHAQTAALPVQGGRR